MTNFPSLTGKQLLMALQRAGFAVIRVRGSYHFLRHTDGRSSVVPLHGNETIGPGLLNKILRDCELNRNQLKDLL